MLIHKVAGLRSPRPAGPLVGLILTQSCPAFLFSSQSLFLLLELESNREPVFTSKTTRKMQFSTVLLALFAAATASASVVSVRAAAAAAGAADFGKCTPTIDFQLGRPGRKATEGTFLPTDPLVAKGQQDALNPNIITKRVCDQLTNVCDANQAAKDLCAQGESVVQGLGTKDASTAAACNKALGF